VGDVAHHVLEPVGFCGGGFPRVPGGVGVFVPPLPGEASWVFLLFFFSSGASRFLFWLVFASLPFGLL